MLGFSLSKLLVLAAILGAVWWGYKWISRFEQVREAKERLKQKSKAAAGARARAGRVEEMVECPACKTYQVMGPEKICSNCGHPL